ncbi:hypothetical protein Tco_0366516 [Tanacetum coccineum]
MKNQNLILDIASLIEEKHKLEKDKEDGILENKKLMKELTECKSLLELSQAEDANSKESLLAELAKWKGLVEALQAKNSKLNKVLMLEKEERTIGGKFTVWYVYLYPIKQFYSYLLFGGVVIQLSTTITVNEPAPGLKAILSFKIPDQRFGKILLSYMHQISNDCTLEADRSRATMMLEDYRQKKPVFISDAFFYNYCNAEELEPKTKMLNIFYTKIAKIERKKRVAHSVNEPQESVHNDTTNSNKRIMKKRKVVTNIRDIFQGTHHRPSKRLASEKTSSGLRIKKIMRRTTDNKDSLVQV